MKNRSSPKLVLSSPRSVCRNQRAQVATLAEFTQHIPAKGAHLIRYCDWYSNKAPGTRRNAAAEAAAADNWTYVDIATFEATF